MLIRILAHARTGNHALPKVQLCFKPALRSAPLRGETSAREKVGALVIHIGRQRVVHRVVTDYIVSAYLCVLLESVVGTDTVVRC